MFNEIQWSIVNGDSVAYYKGHHLTQNKQQVEIQRGKGKSSFSNLHSAVTYIDRKVQMEQDALSYISESYSQGCFEDI